MDQFREWALSVCFAAVSGGIFHLLAPEGKMKSVMKLTVSLFLLSSMILPFFRNGSLPDFSFTPPSNETALSQSVLSETIRLQQSEAIHRELSLIIAPILNKYTKKTPEFSFSTDKQADGSISITEIILILPPELSLSQERILSELEDRLGLRPIVEYT
ncbi:MAG: hypothetical protein IJY82_03520 [Oscillospiraceae bacterium]|nr:hypothetical protein [Oscillospiraceae bacterium]